MQEILKNGLARLGLNDSDTVIARFVQYYELLVSYNEESKPNGNHSAARGGGKTFFRQCVAFWACMSFHMAHG